MTGSTGTWHYRAGIAAMVLTAFLTVWTTIVRDDDSGAGYLMLVLAAGVGSFAAGFRPAGMARAMLGMAVMQLMLGALMATATPVMNTPGESVKTLLFNGAFAVFWLIAAGLFRMAARGEATATA